MLFSETQGPEMDLGWAGNSESMLDVTYHREKAEKSEIIGGRRNAASCEISVWAPY